MGAGFTGCAEYLGVVRSGTEREVELGALGAGVDKVGYEPRPLSARSARVLNAGAAAYSVSGAELTLGDGAAREAVLARGGGVGTFAVGVDDGVLPTE